MIHLPTPCNENWEAMTPVEAGRHCTVCNISVTDFTRMNEEQIKDHISRYGLHCGRFTADQVSDGTTYGSWQHYFKWKSAVALLLLGSMFLISCRRQVSGCSAYYGPTEKKRKSDTAQRIERKQW